METDTERKSRTGLSSLQISDDESKAVQKTDLRISLEYMQSRVADVTFINPPQAPHMTLCIVMLDNGYLLSGKSVPADPHNYNSELGKKFAEEDAMRSAWPLFAFALREGMTGHDVKADLEAVAIRAAACPIV